MTVLLSRENVEWDGRDATRQTQSLALPAPVACLVSDGTRGAPVHSVRSGRSQPDPRWGEEGNSRPYREAAILLQLHMSANGSAP